LNCLLIGRLPLIGDRLAAVWDHLIESGGNLRSLAASYAVDIEQVIVASARALTESVVQVILALIVQQCFGQAAKS
jgi:hypothetical protein